MCIDSVLAVIMHSAKRMVAMVHQWVRASTALREAKGARAARRHSALLRRGQRKPRRKEICLFWRQIQRKSGPFLS